MIWIVLSAIACVLVCHWLTPPPTHDVDMTEDEELEMIERTSKAFVKLQSPEHLEDGGPETEKGPTSRS